MTDRTKFWFPARRYGWGWGLPISWQGWVVLASYAAGIAALLLWLPAPRSGPTFAASLLGLTALLVLVCWAKGEPPRWRRGDE